MHYAIISIISSILGLGNLEGSDFPAPVDHFWATLTKSCPAMTVSVFAFICRSWPLSAKTNRLWKQQWVYLILTLGKRYSSLGRWGTWSTSIFRCGTSWSRQVSARPGTWAQTGAERCAQGGQTKCTQWHWRRRRPDTSVSRHLEMGNFGCDCTPPFHKRSISKYNIYISHLLCGIYFQCCWLWIWMDTCVCELDIRCSETATFAFHRPPQLLQTRRQGYLARAKPQKGKSVEKLLKYFEFCCKKCCIIEVSFFKRNFVFQ